ncbi:MAG TPA: hypothetical protein VFL34_08435, partial [Candidatus Sulfotelmatobacter sp.]|nr:hypothetical protein [Candidatus Sulfotelmatobacter sp.]
SRFNVSEVGKHFINPCCFGKDVAEWLRQELAKRGFTVGAPYQEDWGWEMLAQQGSQGYFLGVGGFLKEGAVGKNDGEWRIMVEKKRSIWDILRVRNRIAETEHVLAIVEATLREQTDIRNIRRESVSP